MSLRRRAPKVGDDAKHAAARSLGAKLRDPDKPRRSRGLIPRSLARDESGKAQEAKPAAKPAGPEAPRNHPGLHTRKRAKSEREVREAKAKRRRVDQESGAIPFQRPLTHTSLRHDGSTRHERLTSTPPRRTPWIPA